MSRSAGRLASVLRDVLQLGFRLLPWPAEPGLRRAGRPSEWSPVIVTGNYDLTVRRVLRALRGLDVWVVVAPSGGINVWCAAAGGHLGTHQIVTALKTSGAAAAVRHRRAILPQLAATGVQAREVQRRCGWRVQFGPVYAEDLPRYLAQGQNKNEDMRRVRFGMAERLEMAASWATPTSLAVGGVAALLRPAWSLPLVALTVALALAVFLVYDRIPAARRLVLGAVAVLVSVAVVMVGGGGAAALAVAALASTALTVLLTFDYAGSTPIEGGSHFRERHWRIRLDPERCRGVYTCWQVCPEAVFERREEARKATLAHDERCIRCGACIVQCPFDALHFEDEAGHQVEPDVIRRYKLNLLGQRVVGGPGPHP